MENQLTNKLQYIGVHVFAPVVAFVSPTNDFMFGLVICFAFNIWCGMRADGISITNCKNFSGRKFKNALLELLTYFVIVYVIFASMKFSGDEKEALMVIKTLSYIFMGLYIQNGFKNLIHAYPDNKAYRLIYHLLRFEFRRMMPEYIQGAIDKYNEQLNQSENENI